MQNKKGSLLNAVFLVAGTCVGGGMLALPVATGVAGFIPSIFFMLIGWAFMTLTALFLLEVNLWMEEGSHIITMASRFLGPIGKGAAWLLYLFIGYASLVAYTSGGGDLIVAALKHFLGFKLEPGIAMALFVAVFGLIIYLGNIIVGRVNTILVIGMVVAYVLLIGLGASHIKWQYLLRKEWSHCIISIPLLLTIFSFQTMVPSLTIYLKKDARALKFAIVAGTTLALIIYIIWQWLVLGTVLIDGDQGLAAALAQGKPATEFLRSAIGNPWVSSLAEFFAFFALVTSFLGIALGLFDFLADGFNIKKERWGAVSLGLLVAAPTLFFALTVQKVFLNALDSTGGIGDALLNGFPV
jgi:tyrosine-specific transport protein